MPEPVHTVIGDIGDEAVGGEAVRESRGKPAFVFDYEHSHDCLSGRFLPYPLQQDPGQSAGDRFS